MTYFFHLFKNKIKLEIPKTYLSVNTHNISSKKITIFKLLLSILVKIRKIDVQWGSELRTSSVLEWSKIVC